MKRHPRTGMILALCLMMLAGGCAVAEGLSLLPSTDSMPVAYFYPDPGEWDTVRMPYQVIWLQGYESVARERDDEPVWSWELLSGEDFSVYNGNTDEHRVLWLNAGSMPSEACDSVYRVSCSWGDWSGQTEVTLGARSLDIPLEGVSFPESVDARIGEAFTVTGSILPEGWAQEGITPRAMRYGTQVEHFDAGSVEGAPDSISLTPTQAGTFIEHFGMEIGNILLTKTVRVCVYDEDGNLPGPVVELNVLGSSGASEFICDMSLPLSDENDIISGQFQLLRTLDSFWVNNYEEAKKLLEGEPQWALTTEGNAAFALDGGNGDNHRSAGIRLVSLPAAPEDDVLHLSCTWGDNVWQGDFTVHFVDGREEALPTAERLAPEPWEIRGGEYFFASDLVRLTGQWPDDFRGSSLSVTRADGIYMPAQESWDEEKGEFRYCVDTPGVYQVQYYAQGGTAVYILRATLRVTDENGEVPAFQLHVNGDTDIRHYLAPGQTEDTSLPYSTHDIVYCWLEGTEGSEDSIVWETDILEGEAAVSFYEYVPGSTGMLRFDTLPEKPGDVRIRLTCRVGENSVSRELTVHIAELPGGLPEGAELLVDNPICLAVGEGFLPQETVRFRNHWSIPGEAVNYATNTGRAWTHWDNGKLCFDDPGVYQGRLSVYCANIWCSVPVTFRIADENGNVPEAQPDFTFNLTYDTYYLNVPLNYEADNMPYAYPEFASFGIYNQEELSGYDGEPVWSLEQTEGTASVSMLSFNPFYGNLILESYPDAPETDVFLLHVTWGEYEASREIRLRFEAETDLPDGVESDVESVLHAVVGQPFTYRPLEHVRFINDWHMQGENTEKQLSYRGMWHGTAETVYFDESGLISGEVILSSGSVLWNVPFLVIVEDEDGNIAFSIEDQGRTPNTIYLFEAAENLTSERLLCMPGLRWSDRSAVLSASEEPEWSAAWESGRDLPLDIQYMDGATRLNISLAQMPLEEGTDTLTVTCSVFGVSASLSYPVQFIEAETLPGGIEPDDDVLTVETGTVMDFTDSFAFRDGWSFPGSAPYSTFVIPDVTVNYVPHENGNWYPVAPAPGSYTAFVNVCCANLIYTKKVLLQVTENGILPEDGPRVVMELTDHGDQTFYAGLPYTFQAMPEDTLTTDGRVERLYLQNYEILKEQLGGAPVWQVQSSLGLEYHLKTSGNGNTADIYLPALPSEPAEDSLRVKCTWGEKSWEGDIRVHVLAAPDSLPAGVEKDFEWLLGQPGKEVSLDGHLRFEGEWTMPGKAVSLSAWVQVGEENLSLADAALIPGYHEALAEVRSGTVVFRTRFPFYATRGDGTFPLSDYTRCADSILKLPDGVQYVEEEAFAGIAAQAVRIPDGCARILSGAFRGASRLREADLPESVTEIAQDAFEGCGQLFVIAPTPYLVQYCLDHQFIPVN